MSTRAALLLCVCAVAEGATNGFQKVPQFYTSTDCTGDIDIQSKLWNMNAKDGVAVMPFADPESYIEPWVFSECLKTAGTYSVKLMINETACANNNTANQIVLNYYTGSTMCGGTPTVTPLTFDQCVTYGRGSVKLVTKIAFDDMCALTDYVTKLAAGGVTGNIWEDTSKCTGPPDTTTSIKGSTKDCGAEPECDGCCRDYDKCQVQSSYGFVLQSCTRSGNSWRMGMKFRTYSDAACTKLVESVFKGVVEIGSCTVLKSNGNTAAIRMDFVSPMTIDVYCNSLEVGLKYNIDSSIVSWSELNAGVAAVPHILALVAVVFAALL